MKATITTIAMMIGFLGFAQIPSEFKTKNHYIAETNSFMLWSVEWKVTDSTIVCKLPKTDKIVYTIKSKQPQSSNVCVYYADFMKSENRFTLRVDGKKISVTQETRDSWTNRSITQVFQGRVK